jgi:hypothetical protein
MMEKTTNEQRINTVNKSSRNPNQESCPISGIAKLELKSAPNASTMVASKIMNPQNVNACAIPGTVFLNNLRWPITSESSAHKRSPALSVRPGAGLPDFINWYRNNNRLPAIMTAITKMTTPMASLT